MTQSRPASAQIVHFGPYQLDLRSGELWKSGIRVPLQDQPLEILKALLERPGELVTREELRQRLWRDNTFVDFEDGLNAGIRRLRDALGDNATTPRFIETLPRRGYKFIAPVVADPPASSADWPVEPTRRPLTAGLAGVSWRQLFPWGLAAGLTIVVVALLARPSPPSTAPELPAVRFELHTGPLAVLRPEPSPVGLPSPVVALSPDGTTLAYVASNSGPTGQLYVRRLDSLESRAVAGAEDVQGPFFSPDGQCLAFFTRGALQKVSLEGGSTKTVCVLPSTYAGLIHGGSWGDDGSIVFESGRRLWRVSADGGVPQRLEMPEGSAFYPEVLPGSKALAFVGTRMKPLSRRSVWAFSFETGQLHLLAEGGGIARYTRSGHLIYASDGSIVAAPLDLASLRFTSDPVAVVRDLWMRKDSFGHHFSVSQTGTLAYLPGPLELSAPRKLVWVDRKGEEQELPLKPRAYFWPRLSRDGSQLAFGVHDGSDAPGNIGIYELARGSERRLTSDPAMDGRPLWTPDGRKVAFRSDREGAWHLFWQAADGTGPLERLTREANADPTAWSFSPDGRELVFSVMSEKTYDLRVLLLPDRSLKSLPPTHFFQGSPAISPDGQWIAYRSIETGRYEVYVRPYAEWDREKHQISTDGGSGVVWSADGRELFFENGGAIMAVPVQTADRFTAGAPKLLFNGPYLRGPGGATFFDVAPDGSRLVMVKEVEDRRPPPPRDRVVVVLNWLQALRERAPANDQADFP